jgi:hypothetical protein
VFINDGYTNLIGIVGEEISSLLKINTSPSSSQNKQYSLCDLKYFLKVFSHGVHFLLGDYFVDFVSPVMFQGLELLIGLDVDLYVLFFFFFLCLILYL